MSRIDKLNGRIDRFNDLIESLESKPLNARRSRRIERLYDRIDILETQVSALEEPAYTFEPTTPDDTLSEPDTNLSQQDVVDIAFARADDEWNFDRIEVSITDADADDTFTAGDDLWMEITGTEERPNGRKRTITKRTALANGDYWEEGADQMTVLGAGRYIERFAGMEEFTVTISSEKWNGGQGFEEDDILATQTFAANDVLF
jgi:hypothetical protein